MTAMLLHLHIILDFLQPIMVKLGIATGSIESEKLKLLNDHPSELLTPLFCRPRLQSEEALMVVFIALYLVPVESYKKE